MPSFSPPPRPPYTQLCGDFPSSPHLFNSATSWAFISARVLFSSSSSSSSLEGCLTAPAVDSSPSSSSSPELRLTEQSQGFGYFPRHFSLTPGHPYPALVPSSPDVKCLCLLFQPLGHIPPKLRPPVQQGPARNTITDLTVSLCVSASPVLGLHPKFQV